MLNGQHFKFLKDVLPTVAFVGPGESDDLHYAFLVPYLDVKAFGR